MKLRLRRFVTFPVLLLGLSLGLAPRIAQAYPLPSADRADASPPIPPPDNVTLPGPLASFLRLAGISQKITPAEVLPLLTRNVYLQGFQNGQPTEFLRLLDRYVAQARELQILAGPTSTIRVTNCADVGTLIQILGYRLRNGCGDHASLETANPERAFLTIDSNFPPHRPRRGPATGNAFRPFLPVDPHSRALPRERLDWPERRPEAGVQQPGRHPHQRSRDRPSLLGA